MNHLQKRRVALKYESTRLQFASDYRELMREYGVSYDGIAKVLGLSGTKVRELINREPLNLEQMTALIDVLNEAGTCRIVFVIPRP